MPVGSGRKRRLRREKAAARRAAEEAAQRTTTATPHVAVAPMDKVDKQEKFVRVSICDCMPEANASGDMLVTVGP